jgi:hypothetical protein
MLEVSSAPVRNTAGDIVAGVSTLADVTERNRREQQGQFLAELTAYLYASLDYRATLTRVARQVAPALADWCVIDLIQDAHVETVVLHHANTVKAAAARRLRQEHPFAPDAEHGLAAVLRTGQSELNEVDAPDVHDLVVTSGTETGVQPSSIVAPLVARATTICRRRGRASADNASAGGHGGAQRSRDTVGCRKRARPGGSRRVARPGRRGAPPRSRWR